MLDYPRSSERPAIRSIPVKVPSVVHIDYLEQMPASVMTVSVCACLIDYIKSSPGTISCKGVMGMICCYEFISYESQENKGDYKGEDEQCGIFHAAIKKLSYLMVMK